ncbi:MAG TPA: hypothetical protein VM925_34165 [Labilithrix sp.]|nr:hypothetical protein [Labilithrix sp.]
MSSSSRLRFAALSLFVVLVGCTNASAQEDSTQKSTGAAPTISDLTYGPNETNVGQSTLVSGELVFEDVDGDVAELALEVRVPGTDVPQALPRQSTKANGTQNGKVAIVVSLAPPVVGDYEFVVYLVDAKGNESNRLTGVIQAK